MVKQYKKQKTSHMNIYEIQYQEYLASLNKNPLPLTTGGLGAMFQEYYRDCYETVDKENKILKAKNKDLNDLYDSCSDRLTDAQDRNNILEHAAATQEALTQECLEQNLELRKAAYRVSVRNKHYKTRVTQLHRDIDKHEKSLKSAHDFIIQACAECNCLRKKYLKYLDVIKNDPDLITVDLVTTEEESGEETEYEIIQEE